VEEKAGLVINFASFWVSYCLYFIGDVGEVGVVIMSVAILVSSSQSMEILFIALCFDVKWRGAKRVLYIVCKYLFFLVFL